MDRGSAAPMGEHNVIPLHPQRGVSVHLVDGGAVLFEQHRQSLFTANTTAAMVWHGLQQNVPPAKVAVRLAEQCGIPIATARIYVAQTLRQWRRQRQADQAGWGNPGVAAEHGPTAMVHRILKKPAAMALTAQYRLLDSVVSVAYETYDLANRTDEVLGHLRIDDSTQDPTIAFDVVRLDGGVILAEDGEVLESCMDDSQAVAMVKACIVDRVLEESGDMAALHAAAAIRDGRCILFPGVSGAGKSSLVAGLAAEGYTIFGDDTVTISRSDFAIRPVPCGICVKKSGWDVLASRFPEIRIVPVHSRPDNHVVRYLTPPVIDTADVDARAEVGWIVFPRFIPESPTEFIPVSGIGALERLLACFLPLGGGLSTGDVDRLVDWVSTTPSFELRTSSITEAVKLLTFL